MSIGTLSALFTNTRLDKRAVDVFSGKIAGHQKIVESEDVGAKQATAIDEDIQGRFLEYGVENLWYIAHKDNIASIIKYGIQSHCVVNQLKIKRRDISNLAVQQLRERLEPFSHRRIHEYVPFYINPRNPMLYALRNSSDNLCLIEVSLSALSDGKYIISDGNAASGDTKFYDSVEQLDRLPWDALNAAYWSNINDGSRKRCSEVLVRPKVDAKYIKAIHCRSVETACLLSSCRSIVKVSPHKYF
jgi:hypothetical protein